MCIDIDKLKREETVRLWPSLGKSAWGTTQCDIVESLMTEREREREKRLQCTKNR